MEGVRWGKRLEAKALEAGRGSLVEERRRARDGVGRCRVGGRHARFKVGLAHPTQSEIPGNTP